MLTTAGDDPAKPIPVAIETPRGLLVAALRQTGRQIHAINPMAAARYRERHTVAREKSVRARRRDELANILRVDAHARQLLAADNELAQPASRAGSGGGNRLTNPWGHPLPAP
ncbi:MULTISPECIES: hypothetical protein [Actinoalloteichus]|uniref:hypothetical protein n=1 Tax=Actinoalloteichus TaxID=65496 RepID=UPI00307C8646